MTQERIQDWFGDEPPQCALCEFGRWNAAHTLVLCQERGIMEPDSRCRRYRYDPFRREPKQPPELPKFDPKEFEL